MKILNHLDFPYITFYLQMILLNVLRFLHLFEEWKYTKEYIKIT